MPRNKVWNRADYSGELANVRWQNTVMRLRIKEALDELGMITNNYPAPIVNAIEILQCALEEKV